MPLFLFGSRRESSPSMPELPSDQRSRRVRMPAWLTSAVVHGGLLIGLSLVLRVTPQGTGNEQPPIRSAGIVLVRQVSGEKEYFDGQTERGSTAQTDITEPPDPGALAAALPSASETAIDLSGDLPSSAPARDHAVSGAGTGVDGSGLADAGQLQGGSQRSGLLGGTKTQVFGVQGQGNRFVYVFDRSGSMSGFGGRPLRAAQSELLGSLKDLERVNQFQIIFYNERPRFFSPDGSSPQLQWGDNVSKQLAERFVRGITADGGTEHLQALTMALRLSPDVIFFLTDADEPELTPAELARIDRLNRGTTIHAIEFGFGPQRKAHNFLVELARRNYGEHRYIDISQLPE